MKKVQKISIGILFLLLIGMIAAVYQTSGYTRNYSSYYPNWDECPLPFGDKAIDIAVGYKGGGVYCTDADTRARGVWKWHEWHGEWDWVRAPRHFTRISVDDKGVLWGISTYNEIWQRQTNGYWYRFTKVGLPSSKLIDIACDFNAGSRTLYVVLEEKVSYTYRQGKWKSVSGASVTRVSVDGASGAAFAINGDTRRTYQGFMGGPWDEFTPNNYPRDDVAIMGMNYLILGRYGVRFLGTAAWYYNDQYMRWDSICKLYGERGYIYATNIDVGRRHSGDQNMEVWITNFNGEVYHKTIYLSN